MKYQLKQIHCRPWTLSGLSLPLIESHYENNYGGAMRRLNAITGQLASLDFAKAPGYVVAGLKRDIGLGVEGSKVEDTSHLDDDGGERRVYQVGFHAFTEGTP